MGEYSKAIFERDSLPEICFVFAGAYVSGRKNLVRRSFDEWERVRGSWIKYTYATGNGREYLILFGIYGAALMLEVLHLLNDGGAQTVFFIGSMYSKNLNVGDIVIPKSIIDKAGIVMIADPHLGEIRPDGVSIKKLTTALDELGIAHYERKIASVPSVLHRITHVRDFVENSSDIEGCEMELSTFHHFAPRLGLKAHSLLYVWDTPKHGIITGPAEIRKKRYVGLRNAVNAATKVAGGSV